MQTTQRTKFLIGIAVAMLLSGLGSAMPEWFCPCGLGHICPCPGGGPGFMDAWGNGSMTTAVQPLTSTACDSSHGCQVTTQGTLTAQTFFGAGGEIGEKQPWVAIQTIDFAHPSPYGAGRACYPVGGQLSITDSNDSNSTLLFYFQGQGCQVGNNDLSRLLVTASYILAADSTGRFNGVSGIGSISVYSATGLSGDAPADSIFPISMSGNFHFPVPQPASASQQTGAGRLPARADAKAGTRVNRTSAKSGYGGTQ